MAARAYTLKPGTTSLMTGVPGSFNIVILEAGKPYSTSDKAVQAILEASDVVARVTKTKSPDPKEAA